MTFVQKMRAFNVDEIDNFIFLSHLSLFVLKVSPLSRNKFFYLLIFFLTLDHSFLTVGP